MRPDPTKISNNPYPVNPLGFLIGSFLGSILYGIHVSQVYRYASTYGGDSIKFRLLVSWIFLLSTLQVLILIAGSWKYYVEGIWHPEIWGTFWWPLSFQDGLIPLMGFTAQLYFGRRAWALLGRRRWFGIVMIFLPIITLFTGFALAITAYVWTRRPFVSLEEFQGRVIGVPSQVVAILWMGLSAVTDGIVTATLIHYFWSVRSQTKGSRPNKIIKQLIALTLETVFLTHFCAAIMCVLFLVGPPSRRTESPVFWMFLGIITELYALSLLFTINSRSSSGIQRAIGNNRKPDVKPGPSGLTHFDPADTSAWDHAVEGPGTSLPVISYGESSSEPSSTDAYKYGDKGPESGSGSSRTKCDTERMMEEGETRLDMIDFLKGSNWEDEEDSRRTRMSGRPRA